jgi:hypothetical protein
VRPAHDPNAPGREALRVDRRPITLRLAINGAVGPGNVDRRPCWEAEFRRFPPVGAIFSVFRVGIQARFWKRQLSNPKPPISN